MPSWPGFTVLQHRSLTAAETAHRRLTIAPLLHLPAAAAAAAADFVGYRYLYSTNEALGLFHHTNRSK